LAVGEKHWKGGKTKSLVVSEYFQGDLCKKPCECGPDSKGGMRGGGGFLSARGKTVKHVADTGCMRSKKKMEFGALMMGTKLGGVPC